MASLANFASFGGPFDYFRATASLFFPCSSGFLSVFQVLLCILGWWFFFFFFFFKGCSGILVGFGGFVGLGCFRASLGV